jgi:hypothetical protein
MQICQHLNQCRSVENLLKPDGVTMMIAVIMTVTVLFLR